MVGMLSPNSSPCKQREDSGAVRTCDLPKKAKSMA